MLNGCSGESPIKDAPKIVSGLVVKTLIETPFLVLNLISAPIDLPIQFSCIDNTLFGQPDKLSNSFTKSSAKSVIFKNHCDNFF